MRVRDLVPQRERPLELRVGLRQAENRLDLARRLDRGGERLGVAASRGPVGRELGGRGGAAALELVGEPGVQLLAFAGEDRRVDRLGQERVPEAEAPGRRLGDKDFVLDGPAQPRADRGLRERRRVAQQRVADVAPGGRGQAQETLRRRVEARDALQQQIAQAAWKLTGPVGRREQFLGEERIALGARGDRIRYLGRQRRVGARRQQPGQIRARERPELDQGPRPRAPDAGGEPAHPLGRGRLVGAMGGEQEHAPVVEVVSEEEDQVERRRVRPVQILQYEQHGRRALREQAERLLEHLQPRGRGRAVGPPELSERMQRLDERLVRQRRADEVDRSPEHDLEVLGTRMPRELGGQPRLADARLPREQDGQPAPGARRFERALELRKLAFPPDEHLGVASFHRGQYPPATAPSPPEDTDARGER